MEGNSNISPEMLNNLIEMLKKNETNMKSNKVDNNNSTSSDNVNFSLDDILKNFSSNSNNKAKSDSSSDSTNKIDFETILKIKSIMESLNQKNDPDSNLLYSLKPYLRKSRQDKLDQYVNILKISHISKFLKNKS